MDNSSSDQNHRPTLPSIRALFGDELSRPPSTSQDFPHPTVVGFRVSDEEDGHVRPSQATYGHISRLQDFGHTHHPSLGMSPPLGHNHHPSHLPRQENTPTYFSPSYRDTHVWREDPRYFTQSPPGPRPDVTTLPSMHLHRYGGSLQSVDYTSVGRPRSGHDSLPNITTTGDRKTLDDERSHAGREGTPEDRSMAMRSQHLDENPAKYECQYCGKGFNRPSSLRIHLNSHTGEKPFVCPVENCGRSFSVLSNMRRHSRVHLNLPPGPTSDNTPGP